MDNRTIFTPNSLNIFTDASIKKLHTGETIGSAGCLVVIDVLEERKTWAEYRIFRNTTNNNSELKAILLGVQNAIRFRREYGRPNNRTIRLFSDSQISIFGLRDRIFNWGFRDNSYIGYDNKPIKNQDVILEIINTIIDNDIHIDFYHQKGHVSYNNESLNNAMHVFSVSNNIRENIDIDFIKQISKFSNDVDTLTRDSLKNIESLPPEQYIEPIYFNNIQIDINKYHRLIK